MIRIDALKWAADGGADAANKDHFHPMGLHLVVLETGLVVLAEHVTRNRGHEAHRYRMEVVEPKSAPPPVAPVPGVSVAPAPAKPTPVAPGRAGVKVAPRPKPKATGKKE